MSHAGPPATGLAAARKEPQGARTALVTGAASGMGQRFAVALAARGWSLILVDVDEPGLAATRALCGSAPARSVPCDVGSAERVAELAASLDGGLDLLVNCAGILGPGRFAEQPLERFARVVQVDLMGTVHMVHATLPALRRARGHVVNIASTASLHGWPMLAAYSAAKGAVENYSEAVRAELAEEGIGLTCVFPLLVETPMLSRGETPPILRGARIGADEVVARTLRAVERKQARLYVPRTARLVALLHGVAPPLLDWWGARAGLRRRRS
jgi:NAD(P)-dependent dehydrogenase (short-subunit alcohol dehydrogenase family)